MKKQTRYKAKDEKEQAVQTRGWFEIRYGDDGWYCLSTQSFATLKQAKKFMEDERVKCQNMADKHNAAYWLNMPKTIIYTVQTITDVASYPQG